MSHLFQFVFPVGLWSFTLSSRWTIVACQIFHFSSLPAEGFGHPMPLPYPSLLLLRFHCRLFKFCVADYPAMSFIFVRWQMKIQMRTSWVGRSTRFCVDAVFFHIVDLSSRCHRRGLSRFRSDAKTYLIHLEYSLTWYVVFYLVNVFLLPIHLYTFDLSKFLCWRWC